MSTNYDQPDATYDPIIRDIECRRDTEWRESVEASCKSPPVREGDASGGGIGASARAASSPGPAAV
mgnify:CR=1 FL=1